MSPSRSHLRRSVALLAATLSIALLAGACGGSDDDGGGGGGGGGGGEETSPIDAANCPAGALDDATGVTEITVWHPYNALTKETIEKAAADYNASQDKVKVNVEAQGTYPELLKKYEDSLGNPESLPDVIFSEDTTLQFMVDSGSVIAADDCAAADPDSAAFYDGLLAPVRAAYTAQGKLWASAYGVSMPIMYQNNDHLRAAGLDPEDPPATLAEVREAAEKIKAANLPGLEAPVVMQLYGWFPENWITGAEVDIVNEGNGRDGLATESLFDSETATEVVTWINDMAEDGLLKAYPYSADISQFLAIGQNTASILIDGSRAITSVDAVAGGTQVDTGGVDGVDDLDAEELQGLDVDVSPLPGVTEPGKGAVWGSAAFLVAGDDDASVAAGWDFLKYFNSTPVQTQWLIQGSYLPVTEEVQQAPEVQEFFTSTRSGEWLATTNEQLMSLDDFPSPAIGPYNQFRAGIHTMLDDVVLGDTSVEDGIAAFDEQVQADLESYAEEVGG